MELLNKLLNGDKLAENEISDLILSEYSVDDIYDNDLNRWTRSVSTIVEANNRFFRIDWDEGLTEHQENQYPCQPYEVEKIEKEVTRIETNYIKKISKGITEYQQKMKDDVIAQFDFEGAIKLLKFMNDTFPNQMPLFWDKDTPENYSKNIKNDLSQMIDTLFKCYNQKSDDEFTDNLHGFPFQLELYLDENYPEGIYELHVSLNPFFGYESNINYQEEDETI